MPTKWNKISWSASTMQSRTEVSSPAAFVTINNEFGDFLLLKKWTASQLTLKTAVSHSGLQLSSGSVWMLGPDIVIGKDSRLIDPKASNFVGISHVDCRFTGQTQRALPISISLPLQPSVLHQLVDAMGSIMGNNFYPAVLALGSGVMALHYTQLINKRGHCHVPVLHGMSQTGKTTALQLALAIIILLPWHKRGILSKMLLINFSGWVWRPTVRNNNGAAYRGAV